MWPAFVAATLVETLLWHWLPAAGDGPDYILGAFLIAMALNLIVAAGVAPAVGALWRRRRRDLPRAIANDQAGTVLVGVLLVATVVAGIVHRGGLQADDRDRSAAYVATSTYVHNQAPQLTKGLIAMDAVEIEEGIWRSCVPAARAGPLPVPVRQRDAVARRRHAGPGPDAERPVPALRIAAASSGVTARASETSVSPARPTPSPAPWRGSSGGVSQSSSRPRPQTVKVAPESSAAVKVSGSRSRSVA